jgi:hypothetical protein
MRRTQLYLAEECSRVLHAESQRRGMTISALVRDAIEQVYGRSSAQDRAALIDRLAGVWSDRADLSDSDARIRELRRSERGRRWETGGDGEVSPRQRRRHRVAQT